jgi:transcriptional regulator with XRE-family HTH domain
MIGTMKVFKTIAIEVQDLPDRIKTVRMADGRSLSEICRQVGMSPMHWYRIEKGAHALPIETLRKIERVLGVSFGVSDVDLR